LTNVTFIFTRSFGEINVADCRQDSGLPALNVEDEPARFAGHTAPSDDQVHSMQAETERKRGPPENVVMDLVVGETDQSDGEFGLGHVVE